MGSMNEAMFEYAMTISRLLRYGYELLEIDYGEDRLDIGPCLRIRKGENIIKIYDYGELECICNVENQRELNQAIIA